MLGLGRQLLNDGGEEKVVAPPGRNDESEKLKKSVDETAEGILLALVNSKPEETDSWVFGLIFKLNYKYQTK